jgi:glycosyltransferase involved in cell wall biosynthesis
MTLPSDNGTKPDRACAPFAGRLACCMPVKDPGPEFALTLASFTASTIRPYLIVVDDGSRSPIQIDFQARELTGVVLRLDRNVGVAAALNIAFRRAMDMGFEFIARMDADDILYPARFEHQLNFLDQTPDCLCVVSAADLIDESGRVIGRRGIPDRASLRRRMAINNVLIHPTALFRADYVKRLGLYSEAYPLSEDYEYFARGLRAGCVQMLDEALIQYRVSTASVSFKKAREQVRHRLRVQWDSRGHLGPWVYLGMVRSGLILMLHVLMPHAALRRLKIGWQRRLARHRAGPL